VVGDERVKYKVEGVERVEGVEKVERVEKPSTFSTGRRPLNSLNRPKATQLSQL
jgi:hypothetical protein